MQLILVYILCLRIRFCDVIAQGATMCKKDYREILGYVYPLPLYEFFVTVSPKKLVVESDLDCEFESYGLDSFRLILLSCSEKFL